MIPAAQTMKCSACLEEIPENSPIGLVNGEWCCEECVDFFGGIDFFGGEDPDSDARRAA